MISVVFHPVGFLFIVVSWSIKTCDTAIVAARHVLPSLLPHDLCVVHYPQHLDVSVSVDLFVYRLDSPIHHHYLYLNIWIYIFIYIYCIYVYKSTHCIL